MRQLIFLVLFLTSSAASSYDIEQASNNFSHEVTQCSAYFMVSSTAPTLSEATVKNLRDRFSSLLEVSVALSSDKLTKARFELEVETIRRMLDGSWANMSIVNKEYGYRCIDLANDPAARYQYWIKKTD